MSSHLALQALLFAGECLLASVLLMAAAWIGTRFCHRASLRHLMWSTAFGTMAVFPLAALIAPSRAVLALPSEAAPQLMRIPAAALLHVALAAETLPPARAPGFDMHDAALVLFGLWLAGALWFTLRLLVGAYGLRVLRRHSRPHAVPGGLPWIPATRRECDLRLSSTHQGPLAWGLLRPVILLPKDSVAWPRERLHAVLLHELAHVRRRDSFARMLSLIVAAIYWPNPLVWFGVRRLRGEAEIAADDTVILAGVRPSAYAGELVGLAREVRVRRLAVPYMSMSMAAPSALEARVKSVLEPATRRAGVTRADVLRIAAVGLLACTVMACARPSFAQADPPEGVTVRVASAGASAAPVVIRHVRSDRDLIPAPPSPPAPPADVAEAPPPPPPLAAPAPHVAPGGAVRVETTDRNVNGHVEHRYTVMVDSPAATASAALASARPEIARAMFELRANDKALLTVEAHQAAIAEAANEAIEAVTPEVIKALEHAKITMDGRDFELQVQKRVDKAMRRAEIRIRISQARERAARADAERARKRAERALQNGRPPPQ